MSKYSEQFKLSLVQQYLSGSGGLKFIAQEHGIDHSQFGQDGYLRINSMAFLDYKRNVPFTALSLN